MSTAMINEVLREKKICNYGVWIIPSFECAALVLFVYRGVQYNLIQVDKSYEVLFIPSHNAPLPFSASAAYSIDSA